MMPFTKLTWDANNHLYSFPALLMYVSGPGVGIPGEFKPNYSKTNTLLYVDTGSTLTSITETEAFRLDIKISSLPLMDVGGIGGTAKHPMAQNIIFVILSDKGPRQATLSNVAVLPTAVRRKVEKKNGVFKERGYVEGKMFALCGLDLLEKLGGKLYLDPISRSGRIEFQDRL